MSQGHAWHTTDVYGSMTGAYIRNGVVYEVGAFSGITVSPEGTPGLSQTSWYQATR